MFVLLICLYEQAFFIKLLNNLCSRIFNLHAGKLPCYWKELSSKVDDLLFIESMTLCNLKIHTTVPWGYRHYSCTHFWIYGFILDDGCRNRSIDPFAIKGISVLVLCIAFVIWVHNNILITKFCLWAHGTNLEWSVLKCKKWICTFLVIQFIIRHIRLKLRIPVYNAVTAIDKIVSKHLTKDLFNYAMPRFIHRVRLA